ncbi:MAG: DISARM system SNF2-like helicase DrmD [Nannocystales bacterium]
MGKKRLIELDREFELGTAQAEPKDAFIEALASSKRASFQNVLATLPLTELRRICRSHELAVSGTKAELAGRIRGEDSNETDEESSPEQEQLALDIDAFIRRSQPTVSGIVPMLDPQALKDVLRRLREGANLEIDFASLQPGITSLAAALEQACSLPVFLNELDRPQLQSVCKHYALTPSGTSRAELIRAILADARGITLEEAEATEEAAAAPKAPEPFVDEQKADTPALPVREDLRGYQADIAALPKGVMHRLASDLEPGELPQPGDLVRARHRQYVVAEVHPPDDPTARRGPSGLREATLVKLVCLDDDAQGRELQILWELELGVQRIDPAHEGVGAATRFDEPASFAAYMHALQWNCVTTATRPDDERVQAPFRAGIAVMQHQLVPLQKALSLPRANLFIADDVGLGKTIEAGLILQELLLRQRLETVLIVCPASICLQWQGEMERRFGLRFEIMNREHMARIRRERGANTNPWSCGRRFVVSYQTLRRPEYQESLLQLWSDLPSGKLPKSMLVLDEAHTVAPASNQRRYAVDSQLTKLARRITPAFENRLFLSATPHNGHSNSFSALLELLDPTRFTRGVPVEGREALDAVMVRRLKRDLKGVSTLQFPQRVLVELSLAREQEAWALTRRELGGETDSSRPLGEHSSPELELSELLAEYTALCSPSAKRDRQVFIGLQKRLLSSVPAFERTLRVHMDRTSPRLLEQMPEEERSEPDALGEIVAGDDDGGTTAHELDDAVLAQVGRAVAPAESSRARAETLLETMASLCRSSDRRPEAKILALLDWIQHNQCPAAGAQWLPTEKGASTQWSDQRLIIFTEYADTARYILKMLRAALPEDQDPERSAVASFHGAMSDDQRRELQARFNTHPASDPVRILVATDAAREGVNLQAYCADLLHYDIPWNPGRLEQRNGRIDRTLQPSPQVRCMYFAYPQRTEDRVLQVVVEKVDRIHRELGSLSAVVLDRIEEALEPYGIDGQTQGRLELAAEGDADEAAAVVSEMEATRTDVAKIRAEIEAAGDCYERSRRFFEPDAQGLQSTVEKAMALSGSEGGFEPTDLGRDPQHPKEAQHYALPKLPPEWSRTLDPLRAPKPRELSWWEWRQKCTPRPVVFEPLQRMTDEVVQLHLEHPVVRRALRRFTAQGYAAHDLQRACLLRYEGTRERVVLLGRMSLFGAGATRLHDGLVEVVADVREGKPPSVVTGNAARQSLEQMRAALRDPDAGWNPSEGFTRPRLERIRDDVASLWPVLRAAAEDDAQELERLLDDRGAREAEQLAGILEAQRTKIHAALGRDEALSEAQTSEGRQRRLDRNHMQGRLDALQTELSSEPEALRAHYSVLTRRIEAVGLVYLVPETR